MRCDCCDKVLSDKEATARFHDDDRAAPPRYVGMCTTCQGFLPDSVRILTRNDLNEDNDSSDYEEDTFEYDEDDFDYEREWNKDE